MSSGSTSGTSYDIKMDYSLNAGSGSGDMFLYVANSLFTGLSSTTNIILFTQFGTPPATFGTNDGFEEWAVLKASGSTCLGCVVPEPTSILLFGTLLFVFGFWQLRRLAPKS